MLSQSTALPLGDEHRRTGTPGEIRTLRLFGLNEVTLPGLSTGALKWSTVRDSNPPLRRERPRVSPETQRYNEKYASSSVVAQGHRENLSQRALTANHRSFLNTPHRTGTGSPELLYVLANVPGLEPGRLRLRTGLLEPLCIHVQVESLL